MGAGETAPVAAPEARAADLNTHVHASKVKLDIQRQVFQEGVLPGPIQELLSEEGEVILLGESQNGKSTMINVLLGITNEFRAATGDGIHPLTQAFCTYGSSATSTRLIDTKGLEVLEGQELLDNYGRFVADYKLGPKALYAGVIVLDATSVRVQNHCLSLFHLLKDKMAVVVALTKAYVPDEEMGEEDRRRVATVQSTFPAAPVVRVNLLTYPLELRAPGRAPELIEYAPHGLETLARTISAAMCEGKVRRASWTQSDEVVHGYLMEALKRVDAHAYSLAVSVGIRPWAGDDENLGRAEWRATIVETCEAFRLSPAPAKVDTWLAIVIAKYKTIVKYVDTTPKILLSLVPVVGWVANAALAGRNTGDHLRAFGAEWCSELALVARRGNGVIDLETWHRDVEKSWK